MPTIRGVHYPYTPEGMRRMYGDLKKYIPDFRLSPKEDKAAVRSEFRKRNEKIKEVLGTGLLGGQSYGPLTQKQIDRVRQLNPTIKKR